MDTHAQTFIDETTLSSLISIDPALLYQAAVTSYECLQNGQLHEAEVISRGLVAANHRFWYYRTLLAVSLQRLGRVAEAIDQTNEGLKYQPGHPDLLALKAVLVLLPASQLKPVEQPRGADELMIPRSMRG
jgi:Flp pilus assembly protein TadD